MKQKFTIEVPTNWNDIPLKKYLDILNDIKSYEDDEEAQTAFILYHLCGIGADKLKSLSNHSYNELKATLMAFMNNNESELKRIIQIDGIEYGFEPNLSRMSYGAYCDITKFNELAIDKNWAKIMSILYRPVEKKLFDTYEIQAYDGSIDESKFLEVGMDIHFGAFFFFVHLSRDLVSSTLNSSMQMEGLPHNIKSILERSGELMQQS